MKATIFENAAVFDGMTPRISEAMNVLVEDGEIKELSTQHLNIEGADRIDCRGKTLMPGMIDNHVHIYIESIKGFTPPEPPVTYRAQYAQKFLRFILSC